MIDKKSFKKAIALPLETANFTKKGQSWYLNSNDVIIVVNLQKNDWADEYFINIGIWLKALGDVSFPSENNCHLSHRVERLFPNEETLIRDASSLEKSNTALLGSLSEFIVTKLIPFLYDCTHIQKLKEFYLTGKFRAGFIRRDAVEILRLA
jgi:hypothetical protein